MADQFLENYRRNFLKEKSLDSAPSPSSLTVPQDDFLERKRQELLGRTSQRSPADFDPGSIPFTSQLDDDYLQSKYRYATPEEEKQPIGFFENIGRELGTAERALGFVPHVGGLYREEIIDKPMRELLSGKSEPVVASWGVGAPGFMSTPSRELTQEDRIERVKKIVDEAAFMWEERDRGLATSGLVSDILMNLTPYAVEYGMGGILAKPLQAGYGQLAKRVLQKHGTDRNLWRKTFARTMSWTIGAGVRTGTMFPRVLAEKKRLERPVVLGGKEVTDPREAWLLAFKDIFIENLSEASGGGIKRVINRFPWARKLSNQVYDALEKTWMKYFPKRKSEFGTRILDAAGYDGVIGEFGEERLGEIMRQIPVFGTGEQGFYDPDRDWEDRLSQLAAEVIAFSIPGMGKVILDTAIEDTQKREDRELDILIDDLNDKIALAEKETDPVKQQKIANEIVMDMQEIDEIEAQRGERRRLEGPSFGELIEQGQQEIERRQEEEAETERLREGVPPEEEVQVREERQPWEGMAEERAKLEKELQENPPRTLEELGSWREMMEQMEARIRAQGIEPAAEEEALPEETPEVDDKGIRYSTKLETKLTEEEQDLMAGYMEDDLEGLRVAMRERGEGEEIDPFYQNQVALLESILNKAEPLDADTPVYRGYQNEEITNVVLGQGGSVVGQTITDKAFVSVTQNIDVADQYMRLYPGDSVMLQMTLPKGMKRVAPTPHETDEEFLIGPEVKYKIVGQKTFEKRPDSITNTLGKDGPFVLLEVEPVLQEVGETIESTEETKTPVEEQEPVVGLSEEMEAHVSGLPYGDKIKDFIRGQNPQTVEDVKAALRAYAEQGKPETVEEEFNVESYIEGLNQPQRVKDFIRDRGAETKEEVQEALHDYREERRRGRSDRQQSAMFSVKPESITRKAERAVGIQKEFPGIGPTFLLPDGNYTKIPGKPVDEFSELTHVDIANDILGESIEWDAYADESLLRLREMGGIQLNGEYGGVTVGRAPTKNQLNALREFINSEIGDSLISRFERIHIDLNSGADSKSIFVGKGNQKTFVNDIVNFYKGREVKESTIRDFHFSTKKTQADLEGGTDVSTLREWVKVVESEFNIPVKVVQTIDELSPELLDAAREKSREGVTVRGVYHDGKVELVAAGIDTRSEAVQTILHEVVGHAGFHGFAGGRYKQFLRTILENDKWRNEIRERTGSKLPTEEEYMLAAEEWFADRVGAQEVEDTLWNQFRKFIRDILRLMGVDLDMNDADLAALVRRSANAAREGKRPIGRGEVESQRMFQTGLARNEWYSQMERVLEAKLPNSGTGKSYRQTIEGFVSKGQFKKEELEWVDLLDAEDSPLNKEGKVTKQEVLDYVRDNNVQIVSDIRPREVSAEDLKEIHKFEYEIDEYLRKLGEAKEEHAKLKAFFKNDEAFIKDAQKVYKMVVKALPRNYRDRMDLRIANELLRDPRENLAVLWQMPGSLADNYIIGKPVYDNLMAIKAKYQEKATAMGRREGDIGKFERSIDVIETKIEKLRGGEGTRFGDIMYTLPGGEGYREILLRVPGVEPEYTVPVHWQKTPNVVVHLRTKNYVDTEGKKVFYIDEIQSDLHKSARDVREAEIKNVARYKQDKMSKEDAKKLAEELVPREYGYKVDKGLPPGWTITEKRLYPNPPHKIDGQWFVDRNTISGDTVKDRQVSEESARDTYERLNEDLFYVFDAAGNVLVWENTREKAEEAARERYNQKVRVGNFPYKGTDKFTLLALKKAIRIASEEGFDRIAWSRGVVHVKRWRTEKRDVVDEVMVRKNADGNYVIKGYINNEEIISQINVTEDDLDALIGNKKIRDEIRAHFEQEKIVDKLNTDEVFGDSYIDEFSRVYPEHVVKDLWKNSRVNFITTNGEFILSTTGERQPIYESWRMARDVTGRKPQEDPLKSVEDLMENGYVSIDYYGDMIRLSEPPSGRQIEAIFKYGKHFFANREDADVIRISNGTMETRFMRRDGLEDLLHQLSLLDLSTYKEYTGDLPYRRKEEDIAIGGKGYEDYYDSVIGQTVKKYAKKWGVKEIGSTELPEAKPIHLDEYEYEELDAGGVEFKSEESEKVHSIDITEKMRQSVLQGQPMFSTKPAQQAASYLPQPKTEGECWDHWKLEQHFHIVDQFSPMGLAQMNIEKEKGVTFEGLSDAITKARLYKSKAYQKINDLMDTIVSGDNSMVKRMIADGISVEDFGYYLWVRHAEERNRVIKQRAIDEGKKEINEWGSGLKDDFANAEVARLEAENPAYREYGADFDSYTREALEIAHKAGLLTDEEYDHLRNQYKFYAPLKGVLDPDVELDKYRPAIGIGLSIPRITYKAAHGRELDSPPVNPFVQFLGDISSSFIKAEKNAVDNAFLRIVMENPSKDWDWAAQTYMPVYDNYGEVRYMKYLKPAGQIKDSELLLKVTPEMAREYPDLKAGQIVVINLHHELLRKSLKNLKDGVGQTGLGRMLQKFNGYLRNVHTVYNPGFIVRNMFRDMQTAFVNIWGEDGITAAATVVKDARGAFWALRTDLRKSQKNKAYREWINEIQEFRRLGGPTGFIAERDTQSLIDKINRELKSKDKTNLVKTIRWVGDLVKDYNEAVEQAVRISAFRHYKKKGFTPEQAAAKAKDLTVDFDRKGFSTSVLNSAFLFLNASIQGTDKIRRMFTGASTKTKMASIASMLVLGEFLVNEINRFIDPDWDDFDEFTRDNNFMVTLKWAGVDNAFSIPAPYGYSFFHVIGNILSDSVHGKHSMSEGLARLLGAFDTSFNPTSGGTALQMVTPSILDIPAQLYENKNYFGGPIYKSQSEFGPEKLNIDQYFSTVSEFSKYMTSGLFWMTGGDLERGKRGEFTADVNPEVIDFVAESAAGGLGKFMMNIFQTGASGLGVEELKTFNKVPFLRTFVKDKPEWRPESIVRDMLKDVDIKDFSTKEKKRFNHNLYRALELGTITQEEFDRYEAAFKKKQGGFTRKQMMTGDFAPPVPTVKPPKIRNLWERY